MASKVILIKTKTDFLSKIVLFLGFTSILVFFNSCKNDLDINAEHKETIVIFGLLDASQAKQYIKVNRAFITNNQSVQEVAQIADSVYFKSLKVTLLEEATNKIITLIPEDVSGKKTGLFINAPNYLYTTTEPIDFKSNYSIYVEDLTTGLKASAYTPILGNLNVNGPLSNFDNEFSLSQTAGGGININFYPGANAVAYDLVMDFTYEEYYKFDTTTKVTKTITWKMLEAIEPSAGIRYNSNISSQIFFDLLTEQIEVKKDWIRVPKTFQFTYIGAGLEFYNYLSVSKPSIGIVQKQTDYTNIKDGYGVFSSRNYNISKVVPASAQTKNMMSFDSKTRALGF